MDPREYCPACYMHLGTSLTSCACGWKMLDPMPPPVGFVLRAEHDRLIAEKDAEIARLREAAMPADVLDEVERAHGGHVWSAVRSGLSRHRERLVQAFDSGSYEMEAARLDAVAREITADIEPMIEKYAALAHLRAARWEGK